MFYTTILNLSPKGRTMIKRKYISVRLLTSGMVIDQSIIDGTGRVLIHRKTTLDDYMINSLRKMNIGGVYIREGEESAEEITYNISPEVMEKIEKVKVPDRAKIELHESVKKRVAEGIQFLYSNPDSPNFMDATNNVSTELMKALEENDALAVDVSALKVSDEYTFKHSVDVASMGMIIAKNRGLSAREVQQIGVSGLLHDLGKSKIPNEILNKPGRLTDAEFEVMKTHPVLGYNMIKDKPDLSAATKLGVLQHHEKMNGNGYPLKLQGDQITPFARILSVADIYDALVTERPYKDAFSPRDAVEMIMAMTGDLDIHMIQSFLNSVILYPVDSIVKLSTGEFAKIVQNIPGYPTRPTVITLNHGQTYALASDIKCASIIII